MGKLLIVDDNPDVLEMTKAYFLENSREVLCAQTSGEGLRVAFEENPDIILLDLDLPDGPGEEALQQLKIHLPGIKVIIVTGGVDEERKKKVWELACDAYFCKADFSLAELKSAVSDLLAKK